MVSLREMFTKETGWYLVGHIMLTGMEIIMGFKIDTLV